MPSQDRYHRTLVSGYVLMAIQMGVGLVTIPLALRYLGPGRFGVWAVALQVSIWLQLLDVGMNAAVSRHLIDYQHNPSSHNCRACVATGFRVLSLQGVLMLAMAGWLGSMGAAIFGLSALDSQSFQFILWILGSASCIGFLTKILQAWLYATQRIDLTNFIAIGATLVEFALLVVFLMSGYEVYALAWARLAMALLSGVLYAAVAIRFAGFPCASLWGRWELPMFYQLASFGGGLFILALGAQLLTMTQTAMVARNLGLVAAAVWATAPKLFQLVMQMVLKLWDYRVPYLSSLMASGDTATLTRSVCGLFRCTAYIGGGCLGAAIALNPTFLDIWTHHTIQWSHANDALMGMAIYIALLIRCVTDFVMQTKKIGWMPVLMLGEGAIFVGATLCLLPHYGIPGMLAASLVAGGSLRLPYAWRCFRTYLSLDRHLARSLAMHAAGGALLGLFIYLVLAFVNVLLTSKSPWLTLTVQGLLAATLLTPLVFKLVAHNPQKA